MKKILTFLLIISAFNFSTASGLTKSGTTSGQFLKISVGARAVGMGGAYVALVDDATALYWNPAGLTKIGPNGGTNFGYSDWLGGTTLNFVGAAICLNKASVLGLSFSALTMPDMQVRTEFEPEGTGEYFSAMDMAIGLSYARQITDRFSIGGTAKYIRQQIWHMTASNIAFDLGIQFRTDFDWLTLGMSISNFGDKAQFSGKDVFVNYDFNPDEWGDSEHIFADLQTDKWELPLLFRFGLAMHLVNQKNHDLITVIEARHPNDNTESISFGAEWGFMKRFFVRGGYQALFEDESEKGPTVGTGLVYYLSPQMPLKFDYAWADWGRLSDVHRFSIEIQF